MRKILCLMEDVRKASCMPAPPLRYQNPSEYPKAARCVISYPWHQSSHSQSYIIDNIPPPSSPHNYAMVGHAATSGALICIEESGGGGVIPRVHWKIYYRWNKNPCWNDNNQDWQTTNDASHPVNLVHPVQIFTDQYWKYPFLIWAMRRRSAIRYPWQYSAAG